MDVRLYGPYGFTLESGHPLFTDAPESRNPGIYLWCIKLPAAYRVAYVGKADVSLRDRLAQEFQRSLAGLDGYFDITAYEQGVRQPIPVPATDARRQAKDNLDRCLVFLIPLSLSSLLEVESGLIRCLKSHSPSTRQFLANRRASTNRRCGTLKLHLPPSVQIEGLSSTLDDI